MRILIAVDGSKCGDAAVDKCLELFKTENISLRLVSVAEMVMPASEPFAGAADLCCETEETAREQARAVIDKAEKKIRGRVGDTEISTGILTGSPARRIVEEAQNWKADLIVAGSHGYGFWERMLLGSVSQSIVQHSPCSVLIVRGEKTSS